MAVDLVSPVDVVNSLSLLPIDLLVGQLRACTAVDLAALAATSRQPQPSEKDPCLPLSAFVAREALGNIADKWHQLSPAEWLRLFHFLRCENVTCDNSPPVMGHLCGARPEFVRIGVGQCEIPGDDLAVNVSLILPLTAWRGHGNSGIEGCDAPVLPSKWSIRANTQLEAVAPVTSLGQVCAVTPLKWGELKQHRTMSRGIFPQNVDNASNNLLRIARVLNTRGECAAVRTHRTKIHFLSPAQMQIVSRSYLQPLLSSALYGFAGFEASLWAIVYTNKDPGFFCFS
jgi:hypothetical protein